MTKATKILNKYQIKDMLLNTNKIDFTKFYNSELIQILEVAHEIIKSRRLISSATTTTTTGKN